MAAEPAPPSTGDAGGEGSPVALRLQVLATEHWGLLATRSLAWNESFTRAGMFLSTLSGAIVALALVAQATEFGGEFTLFALVILPVVLFIGVTTFIRMGTSNYYDALCVVGMNRIRRAYMQIAPEVEPFLVMGTYDDDKSVGLSMGTPPNTNFVVDVLVSTPFVLCTINSVLAGVIGALVAHQLGFGTLGSVALAVVAALALFGLQTLIATRGIAGRGPVPAEVPGAGGCGPGERLRPARDLLAHGANWIGLTTNEPGRQGPGWALSAHSDAVRPTRLALRRANRQTPRFVSQGQLNWHFEPIESAWVGGDEYEPRSHIWYRPVREHYIWYGPGQDGHA
ncbi:MAG: hypothetical protein H0U86_11495 [Chloroflexi bacterium]|nr:hypothetical protein [Chloroflexota bacterium]